MELIILNLFLIFIIFHNLNLVKSAPSFISNLENKEQGCIYENTRYNEGDKIQTSEPCLRCQCLNHNLVCRLRVCIQVPDPPPPGCFILQHRNECCPKLVCNSDMGYSTGSNSIIEARSGVPVQHTPLIKQEKGKGCLHNGTMYGEGSAMQTSSLCEYCYCIKGEQHCVKPECQLELPGCQPHYARLTCCPTKYTCSYSEMSTTSLPKYENKGCDANGKQYPEGEMIPGLAKQCENCYCVQGKVRCEPIVCSIPSAANQHCSPVYTKGHCCPTSYKCTEGGDEMAETRHYSSVEVPADHLVTGNTSIRTSSYNTNINQQRQITDNKNKTDTSTEISVRKSNNETSKTNENNTIITTTMSLPIDTESTTMSNDISTMSTIIPDDITTTMVTDIDNLSTTVDNETEDISTTMMTSVTDETVLPTTIIPDSNNNNNNNNNKTDINNTTTTVKPDFVGYNYTKPAAGFISPDIEAIINITKNKQHNEDYDYDYNEPSLPPSLPNLRIIPFVAADAVVTKPEEVKLPPPVQVVHKYPQSVQYPIIHEKPVSLLTLTTPRPVYYKASHSNGFSPPTETQGGFIPKDPTLEHPSSFYESKIDVQPPPLPSSGYLTTGFNVEITVPSITEIPPITQPQSIGKRCVSANRRYNHGELISEPTSCEVCTCYYGEIICQEPKCSALQPGCIRLRDHSVGCCGRVVCGPNELDSPTRVIDRIDHVTPMPPVSLQQSPTHLPAITVADLIITPDPFRDVIRTEPAPDLPSLMGDIIHLWEHTTPQSQISTSSLPSITTGSPEEANFIVNINDEIISNNLTINNNLNITNNNKKEMTIETTTIKLTNSTLTTQVTLTPTKILIINKTDSTTPFTTTKQDITTNKTTETTTTNSKLTTELINNNDNNDDLKSEQKMENDEDEYKDDNFSFGSMLDLFFNNNNNNNNDQQEITVITTQKPSPFKLTTNSSINITKNFHNKTLLTITTNKPNLEDNKTLILTTTVKNVIKNTLNTTNNLQNINKTTTMSLNKTKVILTTTPMPSVSQITLTTPSQSSNDTDPSSSLLKLAGCNIYGRMYRVGRIITELSGPCLECMCTEIGVQCRPLNC